MALYKAKISNFTEEELKNINKYYKLRLSNGFSFECDNGGRVLPTLRNKNIVEKVTKACNDDIQRVKETIGEEIFNSYIGLVLFDPRQDTIVYNTKEKAVNASELGALINALDKIYLNERNY